ncbi:MAG: DUF1269 domain-containing protein [Gammaproteobacteria bacterium]|nr:DUF1269 domain-containing protein [Gammaproteobacteria bacterium]
MRRRLYFLLPDTDSAKVVHNDLLLAKIEERYMHVIAREGTNLEDLPEADVRQKSDLIHGFQLGLVLGGLTGMILSIIAVMTEMIVPGIEVWSVVSLSLGGAFIGAFAATMIAVNVSSTRLSQFKSDIDAGRILFMVDVPYSQLEEVIKIAKGHISNIDVRGTDPQIPVFP